MRQWKQPINLIGGVKLPTAVQQLAIRSSPPNAWKPAHEYAPKNQHIWNIENAKQWYSNIWKPTIPRCGKCREHWSELEKQYPPDFSTPRAFFEWFWARHNDVSRLHSKKPTITLEKAYSIYWPSEGTMKWYVAVTTAPRKECTLERCISSIRNSGWEPIIFAEPESTMTDALTIHNSNKLGIWFNFLNSVKVALESDADIIMTVQDDSLFHPDSKSFTESILWPSIDCGFISLYTPRHYTMNNGQTKALQRRRNQPVTEYREPGVNRIYTQSLWGACALVWPRKVLERLIEHNITKKWVGAHPRSGNPAVFKSRMENPSIVANSDTAIGKLMNAMNKTMWFVDPSPVEHIARYSTIKHGSNTGNRNAIRIADHTIPLSQQVPKPSNICSIIA